MNRVKKFAKMSMDQCTILKVLMEFFRPSELYDLSEIIHFVRTRDIMEGGATFFHTVSVCRDPKTFFFFLTDNLRREEKKKKSPV